MSTGVSTLRWDGEFCIWCEQQRYKSLVYPCVHTAGHQWYLRRKVVWYPFEENDR